MGDIMVTMVFLVTVYDYNGNKSNILASKYTQEYVISYEKDMGEKHYFN